MPNISRVISSKIRRGLIVRIIGVPRTRLTLDHLPWLSSVKIYSLKEPRADWVCPATFQQLSPLGPRWSGFILKTGSELPGLS